MAAPWVNAFGNATNGFIAVWDRLVKLGDNWYKQNEDWELRKQKMKVLRKDLEVWKKEASDRGLSSHAELTECLDDARKMLEKEEEDLRKKEASKKSKNCNRTKRTLFPSLVENSLQLVEYACNNIRRSLAEKEDARSVLDNEVNRGVLSVAIRDDIRYVPFEQTENSIWEALLINDGPPVVLLEGGGGTGKSTVAHYMVARCDPDNDSTFACVYYLDCGSGPSIHVTKLLHQLIQCLGPKPVDECETKETSPSVPLQKQLRGLLSAQQMLLVLDGLTLRDEDFLLKMVSMRFSGLKILITGQAEVCRSLFSDYDYVSIRIQSPDKELATKIFAVHAGFLNHEIPPNLLTHADDLIAKTDHNPLALATLGRAIDRGRHDREGEWANLSRTTSRALKSNKAPDALFLGKSGRSLWSTLELNITQNLSEGARNLLFLVYASSVESVPEIIIQLLYNRVQGEGVFSVLRNELENHDLITCRHYDYFTEYPIKLWDKRSLPERYLKDDEGMRAARDSVLDSLIGAGAVADQPEDAILLDLIEEFFKGDIERKAKAKMGSLQCLSSDSDDGGGLPHAIVPYKEDLLELVDFSPSCHGIFVPYFHKRDKLADLLYNPGSKVL